MGDINDFRVERDIDSTTFDSRHRIYFSNFQRNDVNLFYEVSQQLYDYIVNHRSALRNPGNGEEIFLNYYPPDCRLNGYNWVISFAHYSFKINLEGIRYVNGEAGGRDPIYEVFLANNGGVHVIYYCKSRDSGEDIEYEFPVNIRHEMDYWRFLLGKWLVFNKERLGPNESKDEFLARVAGWKAEIDGRVEAHLEGIRRSMLLSETPWGSEMASNVDVMKQVFSSMITELRERVGSQMIV